MDLKGAYVSIFITPKDDCLYRGGGLCYLAG